MDPRRNRYVGGLDIDTWTVHCPECSTEVSVEEGETAVACPKCSGVFHPGGVPTAAGRAVPAKAPTDAADSLVGSSLGRWRLERLLGKGGMGRVYEAKDPKDGQRVALKVLPQELADDPSFARRFHRESRLLSGFSHPHVVEVYEGGEENGRLWFAMEYVRGETLRRLIHAGKIAPKEAARITAEIASALSYAHGRGVVHRDLKPENVLLDEKGRVHLADFGLSRLVRGEEHGATTNLTRTDVILGTYEYMAPEQRRGASDVDGRADLYGLGVILYEMLTGTLPFGRFAPASQVSPDVPAALDAVVNRALAPRPEDRFADASAMRDAVLAATAGKRKEKDLPALPEDPPVVQDVEEARGVLRHVEILAGLDRALGVVLLLGLFGVLSLGVLKRVGVWMPVSGIVLLIGAIVFLRLGKHLREMRPGSREAQVTTSVFLLFFPPFLTAMGIYGLTLTSDRARRAFAIGKKALLGPLPIPAPRVVTVAPAPPPREGPGVVHRILIFGAVLWTLFVALSLATSSVDDLGGMFATSCALLVASLVLTAYDFVVRRRRRGLGVAMTAALLFGACVAMHWDRAASHVLPFVRSPHRLEIFR